MFELSDLLSGLEMDVDADAPFAVPNWNYYGSSAGGAAASAITDVIAGGQLLAQGVITARRLQPDKAVKSIQAIFARTGRVSEPTVVSAQTVQDGRSIGTMVLTFSQQGRPFATATVLTHVPDADLVRHARPAPDVAAPDEHPSGATSRGSHEIAPLDSAEGSETVPPCQRLWVRFPDAPDDDAIAQALLAFFTNFQLVGVAMQPHAGLSQDQSHVKVTTGVLAHSVSFHQPFTARDWLLVDQEVPAAGYGRFYGRGEVFSSEGSLVCSFSQEGLLRALSESHGTKSTL